MEIPELISNQALPEDIKTRLSDVFTKNLPLMAVTGDLSLKGSYGTSALVAAEDMLACFDEGHENGVLTIKYEDLISAENKRLYGNIIFYVYLREGGEEAQQEAMQKKRDAHPERKKIEKRLGKRVEVFRATYATAPVCDAIAEYINGLIGYDDVENIFGGPIKDKQEQLEIAEATFKKSRSVCPTCGRRLRSPDVECLKCASKKRVINKLWAYLRPKRNLLLIALCISAVTTLLGLAPTYINVVLIDHVIPNRDHTGLIIVVITLASIFLVQRGLGSLQGYFFRVVSNNFIASLRKDVFAKAQFLAMKFYDKATTGSVINRVSGDTVAIQNFVMTLTREAIVQFLTMVGIIGIMFYMDWRLTFISLIPVPVLILLSRSYGRRIWPIYHRLWKRGASMTSVLTDSIPGIRVIKTFSGEERAINRYGRHVEDFKTVDLEIARIAAVFPTIIGFLVSLGSLAIWFVGGTWVIGGVGTLTLGQLIAFIGYTGMFYAPVNFFLNLNESFNHTLVSLEKVLEILLHENEILELENDIEARFHERMSKNQRDYILREKIKTI